MRIVHVGHLKAAQLIAGDMLWMSQPICIGAFSLLRAFVRPRELPACVSFLVKQLPYMVVVFVVNLLLLVLGLHCPAIYAVRSRLALMDKNLREINKIVSKAKTANRTKPE